MTPSPPHPGVKFPPPFLFIGGLAAGAGLDRLWPLPLGSRELWAEAVATVIIAAGLALMFWAIFSFARARTAIIPHRPASMLVLAGPYKLTRNPMYVGFTLVYLGATLLLNTLWPLILLPLVIVILIRTVIQREERYLAGAFGSDYEEYRRKVGRWL